MDRTLSNLPRSYVSLDLHKILSKVKKLKKGKGRAPGMSVAISAIR